MKKDNEGGPPPSRKWAEKAYRLLAVGRYAVWWLPELMYLYESYVSDEGKEAADTWLLRELLHSVGPSIGGRVYRVLRALNTTWRVYKKLAGD